MDSFYVAGVDPGIVHTAAVILYIEPANHRFRIFTKVFDGIGQESLESLRDWYHLHETKPIRVWIEAYRARSHLEHDVEMQRAVSWLTNNMKNASALNNTGVKQVVTQPLMELLRLWVFPARTHHQDLRSAARIMLYGMMKDPHLNSILYEIVEDRLTSQREGRKPSWTVII